MTTKFDYLYRRVYLRASEAYNVLQERYAKYLDFGEVWVGSPRQFAFAVRDHVLVFRVLCGNFRPFTDFRYPNSSNLLFLKNFAENFGFIRDSLHTELAGLSDTCLRILDSDKFDLL